MLGAMGKVEIRIPLVTWRDGRPRFIPGPAVRALGLPGTDLRFPEGAGPDYQPAMLRPGDKNTGRWFSLDEAIAWSKAMQEEIATKRRDVATGRTTPRKLRNAQVRGAASYLTVGQLVESFLDPQQNPRMGGKEIVQGRKTRRPLRANTIRYYRGGAATLERLDNGRVWLAPAAALSSTALEGILDKVEIAHGLAQARTVRSLLSVAYGWGCGRKMVHFNPVAAMETRLPVLKPRVHWARPHELDVFLRGCDALGCPEVADLVCAGAWTGQRQADRLSLRFNQITADGILFRPEKKERAGQQLLIPMSSTLAARLEAARRRRQDWPVQSTHVFLNEKARRPWSAPWWRAVFRVLRLAISTGEIERDKKGQPTKAAAATLGDIDIRSRLQAAGVPITPELGKLRDQDMRDTAVTWLGLAGCDKFEIAGFTGHAFGTDDKVLAHYLAIPPDFAKRGMEKLEAWHAEQMTAQRQAGS